MLVPGFCVSYSSPLCSVLLKTRSENITKIPDYARIVVVLLTVYVSKLLIQIVSCGQIQSRERLLDKHKH